MNEFWRRLIEMERRQDRANHMMTRSSDQIDQAKVDNYKGGIFAPIQNVGNLASGYGPFKTFAKKVKVRLISDNPLGFGPIWYEPQESGFYYPPYSTSQIPYGTPSQQADFFDWTEIEMNDVVYFIRYNGQWGTQEVYQSDGQVNKVYPGSQYLPMKSHFDTSVSIRTVFGTGFAEGSLPVPNAWGFHSYEVAIQMRFYYDLTDGFTTTNRSVMDLRTSFELYDWTIAENFPAWGSTGDRIVTGTSFWAYERYGTHDNIDYYFGDYFASSTKMQLKWDDTE